MSEIGTCCQTFQLPYGPEELYRRIIEKKVVGDGYVLLEILRYIGHRPWSFANYDKATTNQAKTNRKDELIHFYTCIRFDHKTGRCKEYNLRPHMCSNYKTCEHTHRCQSTWCPIHKDNIDSQKSISQAKKLGDIRRTWRTYQVPLIESGQIK